MMDSVKTEGHDVRAPVSCRIAAALTRNDLASIERHRRVLRLFVAARSYGRRQVESWNQGEKKIKHKAIIQVPATSPSFK